MITFFGPTSVLHFWRRISVRGVRSMGTGKMNAPIPAIPPRCPKATMGAKGEVESQRGAVKDLGHRFLTISPRVDSKEQKAKVWGKEQRAKEKA